MTPAQPLRKPITSYPSINALRVTARITAFNPGQSPPPVNMAIFFMMSCQTPLIVTSASGFQSSASGFAAGTSGWWPPAAVR